MLLSSSSLELLTCELLFSLTASTLDAVGHITGIDWKNLLRGERKWLRELLKRERDSERERKRLEGKKALNSNQGCANKL